MFRNRSVDVHQFAMIPRADIPRSSFRIQHTHKTTFDAGYLIPVYLDEVLPGDTFSLNMTAFCRLATPIFPVMDNLYMDSFFFFVPCRLVWDNWVRMMGEQDDPGASISYAVPSMASPNDGYVPLTIYDYMGLPTVGQVATGEFYRHSVLPLRAYNLIYNQWFRDENLQGSAVVRKTDGGDITADYVLRRRGKRHDYFTSCLPFLQKGASVPLPLAGTAPVLGTGAPTFLTLPAGNTGTLQTAAAGAGSNVIFSAVSNPAPSNLQWGAATALVADLSAATSATINQIRQAFQIQRLLERDARGGTRYTELVRAHFGVISPDARLQRPEYLGGGSSPININPVAQTSATAVTGSDTPQGTLAAIGTALLRGHGFSQSFTEHGYIIGMVSVRADLTYQQGLRKLWSRSSRYDFYFPAFAMLGEQAVLMQEIFLDGNDANDALVFGYQERWAEYRYHPSMITGLFKSTTANNIDVWHLAQEFATQPLLNASFIEENPPLSRILAVGAGANGQQLLFDGFFDVRAARPMPLYSVPGMIDHF